MAKDEHFLQDAYRRRDQETLQHWPPALTKMKPNRLGFIWASNQTAMSHVPAPGLDLARDSVTAAVSDCLSAGAAGGSGFHRLLNNGGQAGRKPPDCIVYETQQAEMQGCYAFKGNKQGIVIYEVLTQSFHNFAAIQWSDGQVQKQGEVERDKNWGYTLWQIWVCNSYICNIRSGRCSNYHILMPEEIFSVSAFHDILETVVSVCFCCY